MSIQYVIGQNLASSWAYTIGRGRLGLPELIVTGIPQGSVTPLLNWFHKDWDHIIGAEHQIFEVPGFTHGFALLPVPDRVWTETNYLLGARADAKRYGHFDGRRAFQVIWPDALGRFFWENDADYSATPQTILGLLPTGS